MANNAKKLYRSRKNRIIAGVCGGLGEYLNIDPAIIRILFVIASFISGLGLIVYLFMVILVPNNPEQGEKTNTQGGFWESRSIFGLILIVIGLYILSRNFFPVSWLTWNIFWPAVLIFTGLFLILKRQ